MNTEMLVKIEAFRAAVEAANREHYAELSAKIPGYFGGVTIEAGKKFARFVIETAGQRCVLFFVELETGNILKAAGWKAPAKGIRGNVETTKPQAGTGWTYR
jgi:hypothetical protein